MRIANLKMASFMTHAATELTFPETGIVAVRGPNGHGKSSIIEAVCMAWWGESLRGTPPWADGKGKVESTTRDGLCVARTRLASSTKVTFSEGGSAPVTYENTTKAQTALESRITPYDVWRRSCLITSYDVTQFTRAKDSDRKRLIELVVGLDAFDKAHAKCKADLKLASSSVDTTQRCIDVLTAKIDVLKKQYARYRDDYEAAQTATVVDSVDDLTEQVANGKAEVRALRASRQAAPSISGDAQEEKYTIRGLRDQLASVRDGRCKSCGQSMPHTHIDDTRKALDAAEIRLAKYERQADIDAKAVKDANRALDVKIDALEVSISRASERIGAAKAAVTRLQTVKDRTREALEELERIEADLDMQLADMELRTAHHAVMIYAEKALSMTGIRAHMLHDALKAVETVANTWLQRFTLEAAPLELELSAYTEKASGGMKEAVSMSIEGVGHGHGYRGASSGQQRRIDIALTLALAEIAEAAHNLEPGTLFVDEAFDSLDDEGIGCVVDALTDLAKTRCIVVVSHNKHLLATMPHNAMITVENGKVSYK